MFHIRMPSFEKQRIRHLKQNARNYVSAYDVHKTLLDALLGQITGLPLELGASLLKPLPEERRDCKRTTSIPPQFCPPKELGFYSRSPGQCEFIVDPPSVFSFYSDIPQNNRPRWPERCPKRKEHATIDNGNTPCSCATNDRDWFDCSDMSREAFRQTIDMNTEHYSLRSCGSHDLDQSLELDIHLRKREGLARSRKDLATDNANALKQAHSEAEIQASFDSQPNIIFLEIDSVSLSQSERFFPRTWSLLQEHGIATTPEGSSCPTGWCAGMFNRTSVVGQSSIVNQLAALSGCLDHNDPKEQLKRYKGPATFCPDRGNGETSLGTGANGVRSDHWLFDVAKNLGYVTFFGGKFFALTLLWMQSIFMSHHFSGHITLLNHIALKRSFATRTRHTWCKLSPRLHWMAWISRSTIYFVISRRTASRSRDN